MIGAIAVLGLVLSTAAGAAPLKLKPASPQPSPRAGLSVKYAWAGEPPAKINNLSEARDLLSKGAKPGSPLRGLDYRDRAEFDPTLTHEQHYNVAADIRGYIKFDAPGIYEIEVWSNDGVDAQVSGERVGYFGERQACSGNYITEVDVPRAGWYPLKIVYFQKYSNKCLMMKWAPKGKKLKWVPNSAFGH